MKSYKLCTSTASKNVTHVALTIHGHSLRSEDPALGLPKEQHSVFPYTLHSLTSTYLDRARLVVETQSGRDPIHSYR